MHLCNNLKYDNVRVSYPLISEQLGADTIRIYKKKRNQQILTLNMGPLGQKVCHSANCAI